jgi:hypothetical protein
MNHLAAIPFEEIILRRKRMAELAPRMQWGYDTEDGGRLDAFTGELSIFMQEPPP